MAHGDHEIAAALAETGEVLRFGTDPFDAYVDEGDVEVTDEFGTTVTVRGVAARAQTSAVPPEVVVESTIERVATGVSYRVRDRRKLAPDGAITLLVLAKA